MIRYFEGREAVRDHIAGVEFADIDGTAFRPGDEDRVRRHIIQHAGGNDNARRVFQNDIVLGQQKMLYGKKTAAQQDPYRQKESENTEPFMLFFGR